MSRLIIGQITIKKERAISSTKWYYLLQPANANAPDKTNYGNPPPTIAQTGYSGWSETEPSYTVGDDRKLYEMVLIVYTDGTFEYTTPSVSSSYEASKAAYAEIVQAQNTITEFEELGLKQGYIWDNMTYVAAHNNIPVYPVGSYIASGVVVGGQRSITRTNSNTYGLNTWISTGGINLRYNAIDLMKLTTSNLEFYYPSTSLQQNKAISLGTNNAINSLAFYGFNSNNKTMELTNSELSFYDPSDGSTKLVSFTADGLVLAKGGLHAGTAGQSGFVYLSTENFNQGYIKTADTALDNNKTYYTRSGTEGNYVYTIVTNPIESNLSQYYEIPLNQLNQDGTPKTDWKQIVGNYFGIDNSGFVYAPELILRNGLTGTSLANASQLVDKYEKIFTIVEEEDTNFNYINLSIHQFQEQKIGQSTTIVNNYIQTQLNFEPERMVFTQNIIDNTNSTDITTIEVAHIDATNDGIFYIEKLKPNSVLFGTLELIAYNNGLGIRRRN